MLVFCSETFDNRNLIAKRHFRLNACMFFPLLRSAFILSIIVIKFKSVSYMSLKLISHLMADYEMHGQFVDANIQQKHQFAQLFPFASAKLSSYQVNLLYFSNAMNEKKNGKNLQSVFRNEVNMKICLIVLSEKHVSLCHQQELMTKKN